MTSKPRRIPEATVARLPIYLRALNELRAERATTVSSEQLADLAGVNAAKVRKDLSYLGSYGTRGVGYEIEYLLFQVRRELGLTRDWPVVIVGVGNLGRALADYGGFTQRGFPVAALIDQDPEKIGSTHVGVTISGPGEIPTLVKSKNIAIGVVATPAESAQDVTDMLADAGIRSILNFAPVVLNVSEEVRVRQVDLALELQVLSYYQRHGEERSDGA